MTRRMSCSMTIDAVRDRTKTVTRRHVDTWKALKPGDRLTLVEKAMGLPKGATQVVLAEVEIVSVSVEPLAAVDADEVFREGFGYRSPGWFMAFWLAGHGHRPPSDLTERQVRAWRDEAAVDTPVRRIEWRYLP